MISCPNVAAISGCFCFSIGVQIHVLNSELCCWDTVLLDTVASRSAFMVLRVCVDTQSAAVTYPLSHIAITPSVVPSQSPPCVTHHTGRRSPPFIHKGRMWPEAAGVSEGWCNLSSWLDSTRMNSSLDRTGSVLTTVLRSCCLERNCFGPSLVACLYSSGLSCNVVHAAAGQMSMCIFVSVCEPIHHIFVSLWLIVSRDGLWSSAITPERLIPLVVSHLFIYFFFYIWRLYTDSN